MSCHKTNKEIEEDEMRKEETEMIGIVKKIDSLGRICIPKSMRKLFGLKDEIELVITRGGILIRSAEGEHTEGDGE